MPESTLQIGVINPYALAEAKVGHATLWKLVADY